MQSILVAIGYLNPEIFVNKVKLLLLEYDMQLYILGSTNHWKSILKVTAPNLAFVTICGLDIPRFVLLLTQSLSYSLWAQLTLVQR